jgi:galactose mutarotase-like enzyme
LALRAGPTVVRFLPGLGMTGVSLRHDGREYLAAPGGPAALRAGHTLGLPLLAPWANRLGGRRYRAAGIDVDLRRRRLHFDEHGLPIHGLLVGTRGWRVVSADVARGATRLHAEYELVDRSFPFPHRIEIRASVRPGRLDVATTIVPTGDQRVPVAFGWHPYLRVPGARRAAWRLRLPAREHLALDERGIPTGARARERAEAEPVGRRIFDDLYALGRVRVLALETDDAAVEVHAGSQYPFAQVWVPPGRPFAALEPMTVPTDALRAGTVPIVAPGDRFTASFAVVLR